MCAMPRFAVVHFDGEGNAHDFGRNFNDRYTAKDAVVNQIVEEEVRRIEDDPQALAEMPFGTTMADYRAGVESLCRSKFENGKLCWRSRTYIVLCIS